MKLIRSQKIILWFTILLIIYWIFLRQSGLTDSTWNYLFAFIINVVPFIGGIVVVINSSQWHEKGFIRRGLFFIGVGLVLWSLGGFIWSYYNFLGISAPYPSWADLGYAPSVFFYCYGVICLSRGAGADLGWRKKYAKPIVVIIPIIMFVISYYVLITVGRGGVLFTPHDPFLKTFLDFAYPIGDFFSLTASIVLSSLSFAYLVEKYRQGIFALLFGLAAMFAADFWFSYTTNNGTYFDGGVADLLFCVGMFLLTFGALGFIEQKNKKQYESNIHKTRFLMYY